MRIVSLLEGVAISALLASALLGDDSPKAAWQPVVRVASEPKNGARSLVVAADRLPHGAKPREFSDLSVWQYDVGQNEWRRVVALGAGQALTLEPAASDYPLVHLPDQVGLFWAEWKEDGKQTDTLVFSGPVACNDVWIGEPPGGMIATCVPFPDSGKAMFVPDPQVHCRK